MSDTGDINIGSFIRFSGELVQVLEYVHRTPGNKRAFYQAKMRNVRTGRLVENRFHAGESVEVVRVEFKVMQYLYADGPNLVCMDKETYEQVYVPAGLFGPGFKFMKENCDVKVAFEGENAVVAEAPVFAVLEITYTEPGVRGNTATNAMKPATLETGAVIDVPLFVNQGEKIKVDTRTSSYVERVKE